MQKIERDASLTAGTRSLRTFRGPNQIGDGSISELKLRSSKMGLQYAKLKEAHAGPQLQSFRLARVFPGWVLVGLSQTDEYGFKFFNFIEPR